MPMFVHLTTAEIDTLLVLAVAKEEHALATKLGKARALAPIVGNSALDLDSEAVLALLGAPVNPSLPVPAFPPRAPQSPGSADVVWGRAEVEALRGKWPVGEARVLNAPLGWLHDGEKLIPNNAEQLAIAIALLCKGEGLGYAQIASDLNGRRLRRRNGTKWDSSSVRAMLINSATHRQNAKLYARFGPSE
jgi:hypothetical protein